MHKVSRHVTVMVMFVVPLLGLTAPAASAASALNITPATGLIDGQTVHLRPPVWPPTRVPASSNACRAIS
jgi:hypothetical protein